MTVSREVRLFAIATLALAVVAVVIAVTVSLATRKPAPAPQPDTSLSATMERLSFSDLEFPKEWVTVWKGRWYPSRPQQAAWTWEEVQRFWKDPRQSALATVSAQNDARIRALFQGVP